MHTHTELLLPLVSVSQSCMRSGSDLPARWSQLNGGHFQCEEEQQQPPQKDHREKKPNTPFLFNLISRFSEHPLPKLLHWRASLAKCPSHSVTLRAAETKTLIMNDACSPIFFFFFFLGGGGSSIADRKLRAGSSFELQIGTRRLLKIKLPTLDRRPGLCLF